jgi:hypothetical protein
MMFDTFVKNICFVPSGENGRLIKVSLFSLKNRSQRYRKYFDRYC